MLLRAHGPFHQTLLHRTKADMDRRAAVSSCTGHTLPVCRSHFSSNPSADPDLPRDPSRIIPLLAWGFLPLNPAPLSCLLHPGWAPQIRGSPFTIQDLCSRRSRPLQSTDLPSVILPITVDPCLRKLAWTPQQAMALIFPDHMTPALWNKAETGRTSFGPTSDQSTKNWQD